MCTLELYHVIIVVIIVIIFIIRPVCLLFRLDCRPLLPLHFHLLGWLAVFFADSLVRVLAALFLVEDGLPELLAGGLIDRQQTSLIPGIAYLIRALATS